MRKFINHCIPQIQQINENGSRYYLTPSGEKYPSVTSVMSLLNAESIQKWKDSIGEEAANQISRRAAKRGTEIHSLCESYLKGEPTNPGMFDVELFSSIKPLLDRIGDIHCLESRLFSKYLRVAGTVDCIAEFDGKLCVIDFKTSRQPKTRDMIHGYFMQTAAYACCWYELTGIVIPKVVILMGVDDHEPLIFQENVKDWIVPFKELRAQYH